MLVKDLEGAALYFKLAADQGFAISQKNYGLCLTNGEGVSKDLKGEIYYFKLAADQGFADVQLHDGFCLKNGRDVARDLKGAIYHFKLVLIKEILLLNSIIGFA
jgi:TPR repeat protein